MSRLGGKTVISLSFLLPKIATTNRSMQAILGTRNASQNGLNTTMGFLAGQHHDACDGMQHLATKSWFHVLKEKGAHKRSVCPSRVWRSSAAGAREPTFLQLYRISSQTKKQDDDDKDETPPCLLQRAF